MTAVPFRHWTRLAALTVHVKALPRAVVRRWTGHSRRSDSSELRALGLLHAVSRVAAVVLRFAKDVLIAACK